MTAPERHCLDCDRPRPIMARGLCGGCYQARRRAGTLDERPVIANKANGLAEGPAVDGLTYRRLDYWTGRGYLRAAKPHPGSGSNRRWPPEEREVARLMLRLTAAGLNVEAAARVARAGGRLELAPGVMVEVA